MFIRGRKGVGLGMEEDEGGGGRGGRSEGGRREKGGAGARRERVGLSTAARTAAATAFTAWVVAGRLAGRASGWATWSTALGVPYWTVAVENRLRGRHGRGALCYDRAAGHRRC